MKMNLDTVNSLPGMCHVKRTSQAKFSIFVTFWDSFMAHVLTWRNLGTLLYYGFSHLIEAKALSATIAGCTAEMTSQSMQKLANWCKTAKVHRKFIAKADGTRLPVPIPNFRHWRQRRCQQAWRETWNLLYSTSTPWSDENSTHDTW